MRNKKADPALQYAPYKSLKGYDGMLADVDRKRSVEPRKVISEDQAEALNRTIQELLPGMEVDGIYYKHGHYLKFFGIVQKVDLQRKALILTDQVILLHDIYSIHCDALEVW